MILLWFIKWLIRRVQRQADWRNIARVRGGFEKIGRRFDFRSRKCRYEAFTIDGMQAEWLIPLAPHDDSKALLYFHGGGYAAGSINTHRPHISQVARLANVRTLMINYRLAPENKFPAPIEDAVKAYDYLLAQGYKPEHIAFGGDSAGGGITLGTLLWLRDHQRLLPQCAICLSPWTDLTHTGGSFAANDKIEPMLIAEAMPYWAANYMGDADLRNPYASPLFGDLHGLPPIYIQVGTAELLLDDSLRFAAKAKEAGVDVSIDVYEGFFHVFQAFFMILCTARRANKKLAAFVSSRLGA
ncbi:MAG: alpha/beta hydrolase [Bacteroidetes bacterium]|nr:alpha/beta hydrolase [Bacteroidota bacterium]